MKRNRFLKNIFTFKEEKENDSFTLSEYNENEVQNFSEEYKKKEHRVSKSLEYNKKFIKEFFNSEYNSDLIIREFEYTLNDEKIPAFIVFFDGMVNNAMMGERIMEPAMRNIYGDISAQRLDDYSVKNIISQNQCSLSNDFNEIADMINFGAGVVFIEGNSNAVIADVKGWERRPVSPPKTESVIKGPHESFNETLKTNTSLVRKILKNRNFVAQTIEVGEMSKSLVSIYYIKNVANESLVDEVRRRISNISVSYIMDTGELEQMILKDKNMLTPMTLSTERPDRVAMALNEGKIAVLMDGSPYALILPVNINSFLNLTEDRYLKPAMTNFLRIIRILSIVISLVLPGFFVSVVGFHPEILESELFFAIESAKAGTPFPLIIEIIFMEFAFELIKEAGLRIPGQIGSTIGIVGALILGQAAVDANLATPILIIIVALTGLGSFATPNYDFAFSIRIKRFFYTLFGALYGFFGLAIAAVLHISFLCSADSFGVPFFAPVVPRSGKNTFDSFFVRAFWKQELRDDVLQAKIKVKQPKISRNWIK